MSKTTSFKRVGTDQAETLLDIAELTFRVGFQHLNDPGDFEAYMKEAFNIEKTEQELNTAGSEFHFALLDKEVVGYIKLNHGAAQTDIATEPGIELQRIYVMPAHQGKGIGQQLLDYAIRIGKAGQFPYLWLGVWEKNEGAIRFYQRHGFVRFGSHTFMLGDDPQTDLLMKLPLN
ncbi:MAG: GNAT family N-acetyltransferase [Imperialibacter sp.]|uniref:GNAT family N-acetyltransferase n=1 Tax=Imperialibacter sp. TaxID=2038411 RepID=UPI0032EEE103